LVVGLLVTGFLVEGAGISTPIGEEVGTIPYVGNAVSTPIGEFVGGKVSSLVGTIVKSPPVGLVVGVSLTGLLVGFKIFAGQNVATAGSTSWNFTQPNSSPPTMVP
jgi:hypothetical protein